MVEIYSLSRFVTMMIACIFKKNISKLSKYVAMLKELRLIYYSSYISLTA